VITPEDVSTAIEFVIAPLFVFIILWIVACIHWSRTGREVAWGILMADLAAIAAIVWILVTA
jgi:hypothetical protein